jgi:hypothetical protein
MRRRSSSTTRSPRTHGVECERVIHRAAPQRRPGRRAGSRTGTRHDSHRRQRRSSTMKAPAHSHAHTARRARKVPVRCRSPTTTSWSPSRSPACAMARAKQVRTLTVPVFAAVPTRGHDRRHARVGSAPTARASPSAGNVTELATLDADGNVTGGALPVRRACGSPWSCPAPPPMAVRSRSRPDYSAPSRRAVHRRPTSP